MVERHARVVGDHGLDAERPRTGRGPRACSPSSTWIRRSRLRSRRPSRGFSRSRSMPGPGDPAGAEHAGGHLPGVLPVDQQHHLEVGGQLLDPAAARPARSSSPAPASPAPAQPNVVEQLHQATLDQPGVPGRVLGLDGQVDRPVVVARPPPAAARRVSTRRVCVVDARAPRRRGRPRGSSRTRSRARRAAASSIVETTPRPLRDPVDAAVVHADQVPVGGQPDVALEALGAPCRAPRGRRRACARGCRGWSRGARPPEGGPPRGACVHAWHSARRRPRAYAAREPAQPGPVPVAPIDRP